MGLTNAQRQARELVTKHGAQEAYDIAQRAMDRTADTQPGSNKFWRKVADLIFSHIHTGEAL